MDNQNLLNDRNVKYVVLEYIRQIVPFFALLFFFVAPISIAPLNLYDSADATVLKPVTDIFTYKLPFYPSHYLALDTEILKFLLFFVYFLPFTAIFIAIAVFLELKYHKDFGRLIYAFVFASLTIYLFCHAVCIVSNANTFAWFLKIPTYTYALFVGGILLHIYYAFHGIFYFRYSNPEYEEYQEIWEKDEEMRLEELKAASKGKPGFFKSLFSGKLLAYIHTHIKHHVRRLSIKTKFTFVITGVIAVILIAFMFLILNSYKRMFTEAVSDVGRAQAEQTAAVYDSADGKYEKIKAFFDEQREANVYAETPFERIDIIITNNNENVVYLEKWDAAATLPVFDVFAYTTGKPKHIDEEEKVLTSDQAIDYLKRYKSGAYRKEYVYNRANRTCKYIYPVTLARKAGRKLIGFSIVTYKEQVLMRQYFRTKVFVFTIITIFLYLSVIFSIFLADFIFNPLLFLRKNVRKTSRSVEKLLSGSAKNLSNAIKFSDTIKTNDEIKDLSLEINEMVGLIKGIMPYVSFSTLQHAEKVSDGEKRVTTTSRDLCFLFTDIRGFTSLCEGMTPKKVVDLLNRYLDIETQIILDNGGDVDKFVGDEMMAFFSGPRKEINACKAAMEIRSAMREQQQLSMAEGTTYVSIGIGINTGNVTFGPVGSRTRKDFTSIGDTVNLAARLEGANKAYGSKSIITDAVYKKLRGSFICRELDFITVKGKTEPVRIYEILQHKDKAASKLLEIKELFEKGLALYRNQKWDESEKYFSECSSKYNDLPSVVFLDRVSHFKKNPPPKDWDGVFKMAVK